MRTVSIALCECLAKLSDVHWRIAAAGRCCKPLGASAGSVVLALLYCCYEFYAGYVRLKLNTDMRDIAGFYLSSPDNCFWVAEAEINGQPQLMGIVAVEGKEPPDGGQKCGELFRMSVSSASRRTGLGSQLGQTVVNFCKERGFSKIVLHTSSTQSAAVALYYKMGFKLVQTPEERFIVWPPEVSLPGVLAMFPPNHMSLISVISRTLNTPLFQPNSM
uniref:N-acetyltransferase 8-like 2 n=1 Tax=Pygocentrus nattereri TaxID=42514 RepID=A0AAR2JGK8_PYGNA